MTEAGRSEFLPLMFEAASALGTVGLSSGVCATLTVGGKVILIVLMFVGRVGVLTIGNVILMRMVREGGGSRRDDLAV